MHRPDQGYISLTLALTSISDVGFCTNPREVIQAWARTPDTSLEAMSELISLTDAEVEVKGRASKKNLLKKNNTKYKAYLETLKKKDERNPKMFFHSVYFLCKFILFV